ncbi:CCA tRNA nucleotidyltransferase [Fictibacillus aquaticus]|uniref:CCA-adding enzyme n=1 Tax=Fictibacillus aquaticus TaxID=2021314 RepID=A0A235FBJ0_9BACL|nr:CCA tRNA nucleotidyltransferase [Fictibacillus aquaticus]OYD58549.1 CCA tRNA nucleotidyltransferase [Fictibacillus aquaticus]
MNDQFTAAAAVLKKLNQHGHEAFFVGGCVRDLILKVPVNDIDIATSAKPEEVIAVFPKTIPVGIEHGTVIVREAGVSYEVTTFRTEGEYTDFRRPSSVSFTASLEQDLARRDFTFNAMAMDEEMRLYDPFGGKRALQNKVIETVGDSRERFTEDPLRIMRAFRFAAKLGFILEERTKSAAGDLAFLLKKISAERKRDEWLKLLSSPYAVRALKMMESLSCLQQLPGLSSASTELSAADWTNLRTNAERMALLALLLKKTEILHFLREWKLSSSDIKMTSAILSAVSVCRLPLSWNLYTSGVDTVISALRVCGAAAGFCTYAEEERMQQAYQQLPIHARSELPVSGLEVSRFTGEKPGPWLGELLMMLEKAVVTGEITCSKEDVIQYIRRWKDERNPPSHA